MNDHVDGGAESERSRNHFHPGANAKRDEAEVQSCGAGTHRLRMGRSRDGSGELAFELSGSRTGREPAGFERLNNFFDFFPSNTGAVVWDA